MRTFYNSRIHSYSVWGWGIQIWGGQCILRRHIKTIVSLRWRCPMGLISVVVVHWPDFLPVDSLTSVVVTVAQINWLLFPTHRQNLPVGVIILSKYRTAFTDKNFNNVNHSVWDLTWDWRPHKELLWKSTNIEVFSTRWSSERFKMFTVWHFPSCPWIIKLLSDRLCRWGLELLHYATK